MVLGTVVLLGCILGDGPILRFHCLRWHLGQMVPVVPSLNWTEAFTTAAPLAIV